MLRIGTPLVALWLSLLLSGPKAFGQYAADAAGQPPSELAPAVQQVLETNGFKISRGGEAYCEIWFRSHPPASSGPAGRNVTLPSIRQGALVGVIRFDGTGSDRRGQTIPVGLYTLRYGVMPMNGAHEGAAPHRDFLLLVPASDDQDPNSTPGFDALVSLSKKASRTAHPAVLSVWEAASDAPGFSRQGDDWVLQTKLGETPIAVILIGSAGS
jgi:hypothetical protein